MKDGVGAGKAGATSHGGVGAQAASERGRKSANSRGVHTRRWLTLPPRAPASSAPRKGETLKQPGNHAITGGSEDSRIHGEPVGNEVQRNQRGRHGHATLGSSLVTHNHQ